MTYTQHTYTNATEHGSAKRLWLQGLRLKHCGFDKGVRYRIDYDVDAGRIHAVIDPQGARVVSGRRRGDTYDPIIDICNADVVQLVGDAIRVRADFSEGLITFSIAHTETKRRDREARFRSEIHEGELSEGTLCAGIGMATDALHEGLASAGLKSHVSWIVDRERRYLTVADANCSAVTKKTQLFEASLEELEPELLSPVSILQASLPCTGHSPAGKAKNKIKHAESHATDATAVCGFLKIVEAVQPAVIVSENVIPARNSASYALIKGMLTTMGYFIHEIDLGPEQSGAFESRRRYWFVAVSKGLPQVNLQQLPAFEKRYERLADLLEDIPDHHDAWSANAYLKQKALRDAQAGKGFAQRQLLTGDATQMGTAGRTYQKRQSTAPFVTRADGMERLLTPLELCRAHGAPETLVRNTVDGVAYEGLGQGVDWNQALAIGMVIGRDCAEAPLGIREMLAVTAPTTNNETCQALRAEDADQLALF